jgi:hypothetical protein
MSTPVAEHPVQQLRRRLEAEFTEQLPDGVRAVREWCADPQFFPGATGLISASTWAEVEPGSEGILSSPRSFLSGNVMVVGNYQATWKSYQRVCHEGLGGFPTTWRVLRQLLARIPPREVFLTNAFIGLPDRPSDMAPFPTTPAFTDRCRALLETEIELFQPRCVVCLGVPAAKMLASIASGLSAWRPWPGYRRLGAEELHMVTACSVRQVVFTAVAVHHPSAVIAQTLRQHEAQLITAAAGLRQYSAQ